MLQLDLFCTSNRADGNYQLVVYKKCIKPRPSVVRSAQPIWEYRSERLPGCYSLYFHSFLPEEICKITQIESNYLLLEGRGSTDPYYSDKWTRDGRFPRQSSTVGRGIRWSPGRKTSLEIRVEGEGVISVISSEGTILEQKPASRRGRPRERRSLSCKLRRRRAAWTN